MTDHTDHDGAPVDHPEGFRFDRAFWSLTKIQELADAECEWTLHVDALCDRWEAIRDGAAGRADGSWLELSVTLAAIREFPPESWWLEPASR